jgi:predicted aspartyl protease
MALVDSGATTTFIPTEFAEMLELSNVEDEKNEVDAHGAGGHFKTWLTHLDMVEFIKGASVVAEFRNMRVLVPTDPDAIPYVVLGRDHIFRSFDITFRERTQRTVFRQSKA